MRRFFLIIISLFILLSLTACVSNNTSSVIDTNTDEEPKATETEETQLFSVNIKNNTGHEISHIGISWSVNGDVLVSSGMEHADGTPIENGEECCFDFLPEDFQTMDRSNLQFDVVVGTLSGEYYNVCAICMDEMNTDSVYNFELRCDDNCYSLWMTFEDGIFAKMASVSPSEELRLVNLRGDEIIVYKHEDGRYMSSDGLEYFFNGNDTWTDGNGVEWNELVP